MMIPRRALLLLLLWMFRGGSDRWLVAAAAKDGTVPQNASPPLTVGNIEIRLQPDELAKEGDAPGDNDTNAYNSILDQFKQEVQQINNQYRSELKQIFLDITEEIQKARQRNVTLAGKEQLESTVDAKALAVGEDVSTDIDVAMDSPIVTENQNDAANLSEDQVIVESEAFVDAKHEEETLAILSESAVGIDGESMHENVESNFDVDDEESIIERTDSDSTIDVDLNSFVLDNAIDDADIVMDRNDSMESLKHASASSEVPTDKTSRKRMKKRARRFSTGVHPALVSSKKQPTFVTSKRSKIVSETIDDDDDDDALEIIEGDDEQDDTLDAALLQDDEPLSMNKAARMAIQKFIQTLVTALVMGILYTVVQRLIAILFRLLFTNAPAAASAIDGKSNRPANKGKGILQPQP
jgi:hypothetical protein